MLLLLLLLDHGDNETSTYSSRTKNCSVLTQRSIMIDQPRWLYFWPIGDENICLKLGWNPFQIAQNGLRSGFFSWKLHFPDLSITFQIPRHWVSVLSS